MKKLTAQNVKEILELHRHQQPLPDGIEEYQYILRYIEHLTIEYIGCATEEEVAALSVQKYGRYEPGHVFDLTHVEWEGGNVYLADITRMIDY